MSIPSLLVVSILLHLYIGTRIIPSLSGAVGATLFTLLLMGAPRRKSPGCAWSLPSLKPLSRISPNPFN
jgi:hypothetical protein